MKNSIRARGVVIALIFLLMASAFFVLHLITPSDGARLEPGEAAWRPNGIIVTPLDERADGLHRGDIIVAIDGRRIEEFVNAIFDLNTPRPSWNIGNQVRYTIVRDGKTIDANIVLESHPWLQMFVRNWSTILVTLFSQVFITFVFLLKPDDRAARMLFLWAWSFVHTYTWSIGLQVSDIVNPLGWWFYQIGATGAWLVFWSAGLAFILLFPKPHPIVDKYPRLFPIIFLASIIFYALFIIVTRGIANSAVEWLGLWTVGDWLIAFVYESISLVIFAYGYRFVYDAASRQKARLLVFAFVLCGGLGLTLWFIPALVWGQPLINASGLGLTLMPFPAALAIAVWRDKVFDIDIIIRRTLIYGVLTVVLAFFYYASIFLLGAIREWVFASVIGQPLPEIGTVISTLGTAALFFPLRRRIQNVIDKRFFRKKYDAQQVLARFAATVRDQVELETLTNELLNVVDETMQPTSVSLWLKK